MRLYTFGGPDSISDDGNFTIVVRGIRKDVARSEAIELLRKRGRLDLIDVMEFAGMELINFKGN